MLSKDQIHQAKEEILNQINSTFPEGKKEEAKAQLKAMSDQQFEEFLIQNNMIQPQEGQSPNKQQCIFCSIIDSQIPSFKIGENEENLAILEINPISKGHVIIVPKLHVEKAQKTTFDLAEKVSKKIAEIFKPKKVEIVESSMFNHGIINVFPVYNKEALHSQRTKAEQEELKKIQETFEKLEPEKNKIPKEKKLEPPLTDETHWLPKRFP